MKSFANSRVTEDTTVQYEIIGDSHTVWINGSNGECIARFSKFGIDVHRGIEDQMRGMPQCLSCTHSKPDLDSWEFFKSEVQNHHAITVTDKHKPIWLEGIRQ